MMEKSFKVMDFIYLFINFLEDRLPHYRGMLTKGLGDSPGPQNSIGAGFPPVVPGYIK